MYDRYSYIEVYLANHFILHSIRSWKLWVRSASCHLHCGLWW